MSNLIFVNFKDGEQKEFIKSVRSNSWIDLAQKVSIKKETLRSYYYEKRRLSYDKYKRICNTLNIPLTTEEIKIIPNYNYKEISINSNSLNFSELIGILLGDGHISKNRKLVGLYFNRLNEKDYVNYVYSLLEQIGIHSKIINRKNSRDILIYSKRLNEKLCELGLPFGNKTLSEKAVIPKYIFTNLDYLKSCLRGLFDSDGSISLSRKTMQITFSNKNQFLLKSFNNGLIKMKYKTCLTKNSVFLYGKEVERFYNEIGSNNLKNILKFKYFREYRSYPQKVNI
jgi:DNA-binding transcriptional regulator WhiA